MVSYFSNFLYGKQVLCKSYFILFSLLLLSGCGFHLKHVDGLADKYPQLYLQTNDPNGDLTRFIKVRLRSSGIELIPSPDAKVATLKIDSERRSSRTISLYVNAQNAEQEISYNLNYSIQTPGYEAQEFSVNLYRDFLDNSAKALAKSRESERLLEELRTIAADNIITTMLALKNKNADKLTEKTATE